VGWQEFLYVIEHDELDREQCDRYYDGDLDECYYKMGEVFVDSGFYLPHQWWPRIYRMMTEEPSTTTSTTRQPRSTGGYQANQYGCHDDGRCLDEYDTWCDESDLIEFELTGEVICPDSYDAVLEELVDSEEWGERSDPSDFG
jgi:hypothetical protein